MKRRYSAPVAGLVTIATDNIMTTTSVPTRSLQSPETSKEQSGGWGNLWSSR